MPQYSAFTPFGHLRFARGPSRFRVIYRSMRDGLGMGEGDYAPVYGPNATHQEARVYAAARCIAIADGQIERARNEGRPGKVQQLLPDMERDYTLAPAAGATCAERRAALDLAWKVVRGSRKEALDDALTTLLGSDFLECVPGKDLVTPPTQYPAAPASAGNYKLNALWRVYSLDTPGTLIGVRNLDFTDLIAGQPWLKVGDVIVLDGANTGLVEAVTVDAILARMDSAELGKLTFTVQVTLTKPHSQGITCTTAPFPFLTSTQRHLRVRVTDACALDPVRRAAINALMRRHVRGVTTWEIQTSAVAPANQLTLDDPTKGKLNVYVLG